MENEFKEYLNQICSEFIMVYEKDVQPNPIGVCYLTGHVIAEGLKLAGFKATETTGNLILQDKYKKNIVYGKSTYKGKLIGFYHTWCILEYYNERIIIDPSMKYIKYDLKEHFNIKVNDRLPDCLITSDSNTWYYTYIEENTLSPRSKQFLSQIPKDWLNKWIKIVNDFAVQRNV
jgi:hypothetical protein